MDRAIATYRRVSKREQANDCEAYERQGWQLDREAAKYPDRRRLVYEDIQSGRRDDRPDFRKLVGAIASNEIDILIITRIDRITRDVETNARLQKLLESKGVRVFEILRGDFLNWSNPNDWSYFVQAGVDGEKESRMLSARVKQTFDWQRSRGIMAGGQVGFPYRRNASGYIEPDPDNWDRAVQCIKFVLAEGKANLRVVTQIRNEVGLDRTSQWLYHWIRSPLIRGHTPQNTRNEKGAVRPMAEWDIIRDTHPSLFSDPRLKGAEERLDRLIARAGRSTGGVNTKNSYPLSGLLTCDRCKSPCNIKKVVPYLYVVCSRRYGRGVDCGGDYGVLRGPRSVVNVPYSIVEGDVIKILANRAQELITLSAAEEYKPTIEPPEVKQLRSQIKNLERLGDPDLANAIAEKTTRLNRLLSSIDADGVSRDVTKRFIKTFSNPGAFEFLTNEEKKLIYHEWVRQIYVDKYKFRVITILD